MRTLNNKVYLWELYGAEHQTKELLTRIPENAVYDLSKLPTEKLRTEWSQYLHHEMKCKSISTVYGERQYFHKLCRFLQKKRISSLKTEDKSELIKKLKKWMMSEGIPLTHEYTGMYGNQNYSRAKLIGYFEGILDFLNPDVRPETEKDVWILENLDVPFKENLIKSYRTVNFTRLYQKDIKEEVKKAIYLNLQREAISCVQRELTAIRRLTAYLKDKYPEVKSCKDLKRIHIEEYIIYLRTEMIETKHLHSELSRLRYLLETIGKVCDYHHLSSIIMSRDIPVRRKTEFKVYSDDEMKRLNACMVKLHEQIARMMIIHQMLGTRISDTMTLETDCLYMEGGQNFIRIRQMKTSTYYKPISAELAELIQKAIDYTKKNYGESKYIFVDEQRPNRPMQYGSAARIVAKMIRTNNLRDDKGEYFGFNTHMYRHYYGASLAGLQVDDWTMAKLLGHRSVHYVKHYRKINNQILADETRDARNRLSEIILKNLVGWEEEYEQVRQHACLE